MAMLSADAWIIFEKRGYGKLAIVATRQSEPSLNAGQRAIKVRLEVDAALWTPQPTPSTTIRVTAPLLPEIDVLVSELPHSDLADAPEFEGTEPGTYVG